MIKRLFKFTFGLIIFVVLLVGGILAFLYLSIRDKTNDIPYELYTESITQESEMNNLLFSSLDKITETNTISVALTEEDINKFIFGVIREKYPNYLPSESCLALGCRIIEGEEIDLPLIGKKEASVKGVYAKYDKNDIKLFIILDLGGIPSTVNMTFNFTENNGVYKLQINRLALGKLNILSGIGKRFLNPVLKAMGMSEEKINADFKSKNIPITFDSKQVSFSFKKADITKVVSNLLSKEGEVPTEESAMLNALIDILAKNEDLIQLGFFKENDVNNFGLRLALEKLKVNPTREVLPSNVVAPFNTETFIKNKSQNFIFTNLSTNPKLVFTNLDFNRIIYDKTNGYESFKYNFNLSEGNTFTIKIDGILLHFHETTFDIDVIININGLITIMQLSGDVKGNNTNQVKIEIKDTITLGKDLDEEVKDYISTNNLYLLNLIGDNLTNLEIIKYDNTNHTIIFDTDSFNELLNVGSNNETPLVTADKIKIKEGIIEISITYSDPNLINVIDSVTVLVNDFLGSNTLSSSDFNITNPNQEAAVNNLIQNLDNISTDLNNGENLTTEQIDTLINDINNLDEENLEILINLIQDDIDNPDLSELYDLLFGQLNPQ